LLQFDFDNYLVHCVYLSFILVSVVFFCFPPYLGFTGMVKQESGKKVAVEYVSGDAVSVCDMSD
jgi:hypothetical protein